MPDSDHRNSRSPQTAGETAPPEKAAKAGLPQRRCRSKSRQKLSAGFVGT